MLLQITQHLHNVLKIRFTVSAAKHGTTFFTLKRSGKTVRIATSSLNNEICYINGILCPSIDHAADFIHNL